MLKSESERGVVFKKDKPIPKDSIKFYVKDYWLLKSDIIYKNWHFIFKKVTKFTKIDILF